jgi:ABC-type transport system involved in multi-copper enzyme maturation permease subunit
MMNPLYWLELRVRAREKRLWLIALFFVVTLGIISGVVIISVVDWFSSYTRTIEPVSIGEGLIWTTLFCQAGLLMILAPLATAGRISQEREQRTLAALINSPASATRIALGKLWGAWTFVIWLGVLALPFLFTATLWGGPSWKLILGCLGLNLLAGLVLSAVSLGISGLFGRSLTAYLVTGSFLFGWIAVLPMLGSLAMAFNHDSNKAFQELVMYLTMYHNPFFPLMALAGSFTEWDAGKFFIPLAYGVGVWVLLGALSLLAAVRSLKREVY